MAVSADLGGDDEAAAVRPQTVRQIVVGMTMPGYVRVYHQT